MLRDISLIGHLSGMSPLSSFLHIIQGYDARYYGYLWNLVFAADMFQSRFYQEGLFNPMVGVDYRREILQSVGYRDGIDSLQRFLGRDPSNEAFIKELGIRIVFCSSTCLFLARCKSSRRSEYKMRQIRTLAACMDDISVCLNRLRQINDKNPHIANQSRICQSQ